MTIFRKNAVPSRLKGAAYPAPYTLEAGRMSYRHLTDAGGLTQFGAQLQTLHPGGQSSQMHWEDREDEFLLMLSGSVTVIEDHAETIITEGDSCCWKAGDPIGHCLRNHTDVPAVYLIVGSRDDQNTTHYPGLDMLATPNGMTHLDGSPYPRKGKDT